MTPINIIVLIVVAFAFLGTGWILGWNNGFNLYLRAMKKRDEEENKWTSVCNNPLQSKWNEDIEDYDPYEWVKLVSVYDDIDKGK